ncbi:MAG: monovalent cation/H(+) antiporter subunit G [Acidobacteriota bacterium]|nr:monovalent cation/H(+) antiporter subunit G [Acidobacteriota bacterium]
MTYVAGVVAIAGGVLLVVAAVGLFVLPDALARQHAATKAATVALGAVLLAVALVGQEFAWWWRAGLTVAILFATLPVSSQMLARAAARESQALDVLKRAGGAAPGTATSHASHEP